MRVKTKLPIRKGCFLANLLTVLGYSISGTIVMVGGIYGFGILDELLEDFEIEDFFYIIYDNEFWTGLLILGICFGSAYLIFAFFQFLADKVFTFHCKRM